MFESCRGHHLFCNMKRLLTFLGTIFVFLCSYPVPADAVLKVIMVTDAAGLGDKGFNDQAWRGALRAGEKFGAEVKFIQSREQADYIPNLTLAAQDADIVISLGFLFTDAVQETAPRFPDKKFIHIEGDIDLPNVISYDFRSEEAGFLGGVVAALGSRKGVVGVVTGMDIPPVQAYVAGFKAGILTVNKNMNRSVRDVVVSVGSFNDPVKGKSLAEHLISLGADVLFRLAGNSGMGVWEAVKKREGTYLINEDLDMDDQLPGKILASTLKRFDIAVFEGIRLIIEGDFKAGHFWLGADMGGVGISDMKYSQGHFTEEEKTFITRTKNLLQTQIIDIPTHPDQITAFNIPEF
jgi:basic membrane protein A